MRSFVIAIGRVPKKTLSKSHVTRCNGPHIYLSPVSHVSMVYRPSEGIIRTIKNFFPIPPPHFSSLGQHNLPTGVRVIKKPQPSEPRKSDLMVE